MKKKLPLIIYYFCIFMIKPCNGMNSDIVMHLCHDNYHLQYRMRFVDTDHNVALVFNDSNFMKNGQKNVKNIQKKSEEQIKENIPVERIGLSIINFNSLISNNCFYIIRLSKNRILSWQSTPLMIGYASVSRALTNFLVPSGSIILPKTEIDGYGCTMIIKPIKLEYCKGGQIESWIYELSAPLHDIVTLAQHEKWEEACKVANGFFTHQFKNLAFAKKSTIKSLENFLYSVSLSLGLRLCESQMKYDKDIQKMYGPCYAFSTMDLVKDLFEIDVKDKGIWGKIEKVKVVEKDILRTAAVYLYVLHNLQCGGSRNAQYYSDPYKVALGQILTNGVLPTQNFVSWALKMASTDSETKKISKKWDVTPAL